VGGGELDPVCGDPVVFRLGGPAAHTHGMDEHAVNEILRRQLGLITRRQARECGLTDRQVDVRVRSGVWRRQHRGVWRHTAFPATYEQRSLAAVLFYGVGSVVSHRAAAALWGVHGFASSLVEISCACPSSRMLPGVTVHRSVDLDERWVRRVGPIPVTTPARTLVDLGAVVPRWLLRRCLEEWLSNRVLRFDDLEGALDAHARRGRNGVRVVRELVRSRALGTASADSPVEALLAEVFAAHGVPVPVHHHLVRRGDEVLAELDYAYPVEKVALEVDGYGIHLRSARIFEHDRLRQNELEIEGWAVLRFASATLTARAALVASQVERLLATRG
jgi:hypothetical protein